MYQVTVWADMLAQYTGGARRLIYAGDDEGEARRAFHDCPRRGNERVVFYVDGRETACRC